jgi:iron(III) transport system permease protein
MTAQAFLPRAGRGRADARAYLEAPDVLKFFLFALVIALVAGPLLILIRASFMPPDTLPFETAQFTLQNFAEVFGGGDTVRLIVNTLIYAVGSVAIGLTLAFAVALLTERTNMPGRKLIQAVLFAWMAVPPMVLGLGWILLINPGNGVLNVWSKTLFGTQTGPFTIYSMWALIAVTSFSVVPTAFVMVSGLMRNMDPQLELAGSVLGASSGTVLRRITLPLLRPGIVSISIYIIMLVVQAFEMPLIVGLTARIHVLSTRIYLLSASEIGLPRYGVAAAFGVTLLLIALLLMLFYFRAIRSEERFRVVTGKGFRPRRTDIGKLRWVTFAGVMTLLAIMLMPIAILLWTSLLPFYRLPSLDALSALSLGNYRRILSNPDVLDAFGNTILLVLMSGFSVMFLSTMIAWFSTREKGFVARSIDVLSYLPTAIPPIVMAIAMLLLYLRTPLFGTVWVLILGQLCIFIAFGTRTMATAFLQIHKDLSNAALVAGASWWCTLRRILLPLVWSQLLNGWLWVVTHGARDLTVPIILISSGNVVFASIIWMMWGFPDLPAASAMSILLFIALLIVFVPLQLVASRRSESA